MCQSLTYKDGPLGGLRQWLYDKHIYHNIVIKSLIFVRKCYIVSGIDDLLCDGKFKDT